MATETKHTPGPWFAVEYSGYHNLHDSDHYGATNILDEDECARAPHNAKLAAAAPELLEALKELADLCTGFPGFANDNPDLVRARAAIKKATEN